MWEIKPSLIKGVLKKQILEKIKTNQLTLTGILAEIKKIKDNYPNKQLLIIANKVDVADAELIDKTTEAFQNASLLFLF